MPFERAGEGGATSLEMVDEMASSRLMFKQELPLLSIQPH